MYVLHEILLLLLGWLAKRPAFRNLLTVTVVLLCFSVAGGALTWLMSDAPARFAVSGNVQLGGEPLDAGTVEFRPPVGALVGTVAGAAIRAGRYSIPRDRGLTAATYDVRIYSAMPPEPRSTGNEPPGPGLPPGSERIPVEYGSETRQRIEVGRGRRNVFDFDIPPRPEPAPASSAGGRAGRRP